MRVVELGQKLGFTAPTRQVRVGFTRGAVPDLHGNSAGGKGIARPIHDPPRPCPESSLENIAPEGHTLRARKESCASLSPRTPSVQCINLEVHRAVLHYHVAADSLVSKAVPPCRARFLRSSLNQLRSGPTQVPVSRGACQLRVVLCLAVDSIMHRLKVSLALWLALSCAACWTNFNKLPGVKKMTTPKNGPKTTAFLNNYCNDYERPGLRQGSPLEVLLHDDGCSAGVYGCSAGLDAAKGSLPSSYEKVFRDLLDAVPSETGGPGFVYLSCDITAQADLSTIGIDGLGLMRSTKHAQFLVDFIGTHGHRYFEDSSTPFRLARALFLIGKNEAFEDTLASMLAMHPRVKGFRPQTLKFLATWESTRGVDYCMTTLKEGKGETEACIWYLGEMRHTDAYELIVRRMEDYPGTSVRALGHLGDPQAAPLVEEVLQTTKYTTTRTVALAALMNLGQTERFPEYERVLRGRVLLSSGAESRRPDIRAMEHATFEALELHDPDLRTRAFAYVESLGDLSDQSSVAWRVPVFLNAATASLGDPDAIKALGAMLDDPKKDVRHLVVTFVGSGFSKLNGIRVTDRSLLEPLTRAYEMEPSQSRKTSIVLAAAYLGAT